MSKKRAAIRIQQLNPHLYPLTKGGNRGFEAGFTLVELLVTMVMFVLVIAAASQVFTSMLTQFKQQTKIAETNVERLVGLEILRQDIEHAGFGLPWNLNGGTYQEAGIEIKTPWVDRNFNDGPPAGDENQPTRGGEIPGGSYAPGGIRSADGDGTMIANTFNQSDVLVIKSTNVARNDASQCWTRLIANDDPSKRSRDALCGESLEDTDRVIVMSLGSTESNSKTLILSDDADSESWKTTYSNAVVNLAPSVDVDIRVIYGIEPISDTHAEARMPFNRADYYIRRPNSIPQRCAPNTGILYKAPVSHVDGLMPNELPLIDCVADMQIIYRDNNGVYHSADYANTLTAAQIRGQIKEVRVYILAHEGQKDPDFEFQDNPVTVGEFGLGRDFNFVDNGITDWQNYRWKVYTLVVKPTNLEG